MSVQNEFAPAGFFVLRTPLLAFDELEAWGESRDRAELERRLHEAYKRPMVREALFLASPRLSDALDDGGTPAPKSLPALVSYFERMTSRPTPFGLFAGCSLGEIGERTRLEIGAQSSYGRHTRLDMDYLTAVTAALEADAGVRRTLVYRPNSSIHRAGGRLRYTEGRLEGTLRSYHLVAVDDSEALTATLECARDGARFDDLATSLVGPEVEPEEADAFVSELIDAQLLVSDLQPPVTGPEPVPGLVARLQENPETAEAAAALDNAVHSLDVLDRKGLGAAPADYRRIESFFDLLPARPESSRLFQLDLTKSAAVSLGPAVMVEITRGLELLARLARPVRDDPLEQFRAAFGDRYEDREVPLLEALDEEIGIGFADRAAAETSPLLAGLDLRETSVDGDSSWDARDGLRLRRLAEALRLGATEIELTHADVAALATPEPPPLPDALEVMATVAAGSNEDLDRGRFCVFVRYADGAPGARLLGRFCHVDAALHLRVEQHLRAEEALRPDAMFAEIVHLPEGRLGNVLCRPVLRGHEIPFLGRSGAPWEAQIPASELVVSVVEDRLASDGERIVLRSSRLGCEVIPRLTSAHNYGFRSLALYRFLCELQRQGTSDGLRWSWNGLESAPFLPRVRVGRVVLARAQWNLDADDLQRLARGTEALREWRRERGVPRWVALADYDNELVTDLENTLSAEALLRHLRRHARATLVELFPGPDELCASGPEGRFTHELVIPFVRQAEPRRSGARSRPLEKRRRSFAPGSEWLYAKLYTGSGTADRVLLDVVEPIVRETVAAGAAERWFFVRYADPHFHVRLRVNGNPDALVSEVLPRLRDAIEPLLADGRIWRLQLDTYERELQRYGGDEGMLLSEELFRHDSEAVLAIVATLSGDEGLDARWRLVLYGIDRLFDDFGFELERRRDWARRSRDGLAREFAVDATTKRRLGERYRIERASLDQLLTLERGTDHPLALGVELLRERSRRIAPIAEQLRECEQRLSVSLDSLVASYVHMHANRLLRGASRQHELVLCELLDRVYSSRLARTTA